MKILKSIAVGAFALAFAACSSNEPEGNNGQDQEGNQFMSISLGMASTGSRAATDGGYIYGSEAESSVKLANSIFLFYDATGNYLTSGTMIDNTGTGFLDLTESSTTGQSVEKKSNATIVLGPTKVKPTQVLAVLNYADINNLKDKTLSEVLSTVESVAVSETPSKGDLILTNSVYSDGTKVVTATPITAANICESESAAIANPVDIYVERTVAKLSMVPASTVTVEGGKYVFNITSEDVYVDNSRVKARIVVDGWHENAINESGYLVKNVDNAWLTTAPFTGWNSAAEFRCFWSKDENYDADAADTYDFNKTKANQVGTYKNLEYFSWNEAAAGYHAGYIHANTVAPAAQKGLAEQYANVTTMLIAAHLEVSTDDGATWKKENLFRKDGVFYTETAYKTRIINALTGKLRWKNATSSSTTYTNLAPADVTLSYATSHTNKSVIKVTVDAVNAPAGCTLQQYNGTVWSDIAEASYVSTLSVSISNNAATLISDVTGWKDGACFYQVPIEHLTSTDEHPFWGVVRNHCYELTLSSISRIGSAIWDKDEELIIIPGKEKNYYVAARLNILAWKSIKQNVVLD